MKTLKLMVREDLVARVDAALKREGLEVKETVINAAGIGADVERPVVWLDVVPGAPLPDVPRVIAHDGPAPRKVA